MTYIRKKFHCDMLKVILNCSCVIYLGRYLAALCKCDFGAEEPEGGQKEFPTVSVHSLIDKPVPGLLSQFSIEHIRK